MPTTQYTLRPSYEGLNFTTNSMLVSVPGILLHCKGLFLHQPLVNHTVGHFDKPCNICPCYIVPFGGKLGRVG